jgi:hypothetical protein
MKWTLIGQDNIRFVFCKYRDEILDSLKTGHFLLVDQPSASEEILCILESVVYFKLVSMINLEIFN